MSAGPTTELVDRGRVEPGATLGVIGSGQLGRMFATAASRLGYRVRVLSTSPEAPACQVAEATTVAPLEDLDAVARFADGVDAVTIELEQMPLATLRAAAERVPASPGPEALELAQHRLKEKTFLRRHGYATAPFAAVAGEAELHGAVEELGFPAVLKTATGGYDGKGQALIVDRDAIGRAWTELSGRDLVCEGWVSFECELSVVVARGRDGEAVSYGPMLNEHVDHILDVTRFPAPVEARVAADARELATQLASDLGYVGVLCVELFCTADGDLVVNELAPRPHNSGHLTIEAHRCSQFEQQVRAMCFLPLGSAEPVFPGAAMANLLGDLWRGGRPRWHRMLGTSSANLHLYGKSEPRPGRKMGHVTAVADEGERATELARAARRALLEDAARPQR